MSKVKIAKDRIKSQIEAIKRINDDPKKSAAIMDKLLKDLPSTDSLLKKNLSDLQNKKRKNKENNNNVFDDLLDIVQQFIEKDRTIEDSESLSNYQKLKSFSLISADKTLKKSQNVIMDNVKKAFFVGDGICGTNIEMPESQTRIKPSEFDFFDTLQIDPSTTTGKVLYEDDKDKNLVKMNKKLYENFSGGVYTFTSNNGNSLFDMTWDATNQEYVFSNLTNSNNVETFFNDYYSSIEFLDLSGVTKNTMLMVLQGDGTETPLFQKATNDLNRLLNKLCALCGNPSPSSGLNQNPTTQINENDEDVEEYFDFDNTDGVDVESEYARYQRVLLFKDCNNFESPVNPQHFEDFVYLFSKKTLNDSINNAILHAAGEAYENSGQTQPLFNFQLSLTLSFVKNLPKALIGTILSPKYMLPIVLMYKGVLQQGVQTVREFMKALSKMFNQIIRDLYWIFITEFWRLVKIELLSLLAKFAKKILKTKFKRYYLLISVLIAFLTKILSLNLKNCNDLYKAIQSAIDLSLLGLPTNLNVPNLLLSFADFKPGYSPERSFMNISQRLEAAGISMGPIYGESNNLNDVVKSIIDGHIEEQDTNSYVETSNKPITIPIPGNPIRIPEGIIRVVGNIR